MDPLSDGESGSAGEFRDASIYDANFKIAGGIDVGRESSTVEEE